MTRIVLSIVALAVLAVLYLSDRRLELTETPQSIANPLELSDATRGSTDVLIPKQVEDHRSGSHRSAVALKSERQDAEAVKMTGLSKEELDEGLEEVRKAFFDPRTSGEFMAELYEALVNTYGEEEAQFRMAVMNEVGDWDAIQELFAERRVQAPGEAAVYDQMLLQLGINNGQISVDEVAVLVRKGALLPQDSILTLANSGNIALIVGLSDAGFLTEFSTRNVLNGQNAIASYISGSSYYLQKLSPDQVVENVAALHRLGVPVDSSSAGVDPLDAALRGVRNYNLEVRVSVIEYLLGLGVVINASHRERFSQLPSDVQERLGSLFFEN